MNRDTDTAERPALGARIPAGDVLLEGDLELPANPSGLVIFAHGSGSSRHSPRNREVALVLRHGGLGTLLFDLLTRREEELDLRTAELRFNIEFLARRLRAATDWVRAQPVLQALGLGYFGASTGAAAALVAAADAPEWMRAVVSRGGRPDLAGAALAQVRAPTLLLVGGEDTRVLALNRQALQHLPGKKRLEIIPGATHLFEEPGALELVAQLSRDWFRAHLGRRRAPQAA